MTHNWPDAVVAMSGAGRLGQKSGKGFYAWSRDDNGRLRQHEVVSALTLFITDDISAKEWIARPSVSHWRCVSASWSEIMRRLSALAVPIAV